MAQITDEISNLLNSVVPNDQKLVKKGSSGFQQLVGYLEPPVGDIPTYSLLIPQPMCFQEIRKRISDSTYSSPAEFAIDFRRVIANFITFNNTADFSALRTEAKRLLQKFDNEFEKVFPGRCPVRIFLYNYTRFVMLLQSHPFVSQFLSGLEKCYKTESTADKRTGVVYYYQYPHRCYFEPFDYSYPPE